MVSAAEEADLYQLSLSLAAFLAESALTSGPELLVGKARSKTGLKLFSTWIVLVFTFSHACILIYLIEQLVTFGSLLPIAAATRLAKFGLFSKRD